MAQKREPDDPNFAKLLAGQLGVSAVLANVLIDKGIITRDELCERFQQAQDAAQPSRAGSLAARLFAAMATYLRSPARRPTRQ